MEYLERIDATLKLFGGRFIVHGDEVDVLEGSWQGALIVIAFPDLGRARAWYASPAYQEILPLRTGNLVGDAVLVQGVSPEHWTGNQRSRAATLALERIEQLSTIGMRWA